MFVIGNVILEERLRTLRFECSISDCKGACCVIGDLGPKMTKFELTKIFKNIDLLRKYSDFDLTKDKVISTADGNVRLALAWDKGPCILSYFEDGIARCGIHRAFLEGLFPFPKPLPCHLFPLILAKRPNYYFLYFDIRPECNPYRKSEKLLLEYCKDGLMRAFGEKWYHKLAHFLNLQTIKI